jgi:hypothetical protein
MGPTCTTTVGGTNHLVKKREIDRQTGKGRERQRERYRDRQADRQMAKGREREREKERYRLTDRHTTHIFKKQKHFYLL